MCFSAEVSLVTFIIGTVGSFFVYNLGTPFDHIVGLYLGFTSLIQGIEFLLWSHQTCDSYHRMVTFIGSVLTSAQPIFLGALVLAFSAPAKNRIPILCLMAFMLITTVYHGYPFIVSPELKCTKPREGDPHLVWNWTILPNNLLMWFIYVGVCVSVCFLGMPTKDAVLFSGTLVGSLLTSALIYPRQDLGSMWCFFSAFIPFIYYFHRV